MTVPPSSAGTVVREAIPADLPDVARLLSARDGQYRSPEVVNAYLWGLDPAHTCTWLAYVDGRPAGLSMLYLRDMAWPSTENSQASILRAGYWAHLFVEPEFRRLMVYPQLVLAMLRGMNSRGISLIYTATRQPDVAAGHQKLGFALVGTLPLRLRPLRPFRLLTKHKGIKLPGPVINTMDAVSRRFILRKSDANVSVQEISLADSRVHEVVALVNARAEGKVHHIWTTDEFRRRFTTTLDGTDYRVCGVARNNGLVASLVSVLVERGNNIKAGVIVSLVADATATREEVAAILADAEGFSYRHEAELMLGLDDSVNLPQLADRRGRYLSTESEMYHLLVYPKKFAQAPYAATDLGNWVFDYADHDAF